MRIKKLLKIGTTFGVSLLLLSGCSQWQSPFDVGSRSAQTNQPMAVDAADIRIYQQQPSLSMKLLSVVTGDSCQNRIDQPAASIAQAQQSMRMDAARFYADAVVASQCYALPKTANSSCYTQVSCFGKAVKMTD